jgi:hypothetical protein
LATFFFIAALLFEACVVLLEDKKKVMDAVRASTKLRGCRLVPFMNAGREVKVKCGFPVQRKRLKKDMAVTHRILGRALGIRNFGATIDAKKPRTTLSPTREQRPLKTIDEQR